MTKDLNPIDVLKTVESLVEQYDALQERVDELEQERDDALDQVEELKEERDELEQERDDLKERVDELEEENNELKERIDDRKERVEQLLEERDALRARLFASMRVATYNALHTLKTTLDDLIKIDDNGFQTVLDYAAYVVETLQQPLEDVYDDLETGINYQFRNKGRVRLKLLVCGKTLRIEPATLTNGATVWIE